MLIVDLMDISQSVDLYNSELRSILDFHTPLSTRTVTVRPAAPWYSNEIKIKEGKKRQKKTKKDKKKKTAGKALEEKSITARSTKFH